MTGLDINKEVPIEVAVVITDLDFKTLTTYEAVIKQPQNYIDQMDDWNRKHHGESGLIARIPYGKSPEEVEQDLTHLCIDHWGKAQQKDDKPVLSGNSIHQDRLFISKYFPKFDNLLHYRMLDVSSWKVMMTTKYNITYQKQKKHRAVDDIYESIAELKEYLRYFKIKPD